MNPAMLWIEDSLRKLESEQMLRRLRQRQSPHVDGMIQLDNQQLIDFGSNDYLSLSSDSRLVDAVYHCVGQLGWGAAASPLISGHGVLHQRLETELAAWKQTEAALLFPTGFAANVGAITSLVGSEDVIFSDAKNHASIIDGCRLSGATIKIFRHRDYDHLAQLAGESEAFRRKLIVTDAVFSMDGDIADLPAVCSLADKNEAMVLVDEAHAAGVFGKRGSGICELQGVEDRMDVRVGTLSKALGSMGGFVAGKQSLIDWVVNCARTYIFSTAQPEAISAAALESLKIIQSSSVPRVQLLETAAKLRERLRQDGWQIGPSESPIIPVLLGDAGLAVEYSQLLREKGLFVPAIRPPAVPDGQSILRISLNISHSAKQLDRLCKGLVEIRSKL